MAAKMTPVEFAKQYYNLNVYLFPPEANGAGPKPGYVPTPGWKQLRADNYRLGSSSWMNTFWSNDIRPQFRKGPITVCVKPISGPREELELRTASEGLSFFYPPFLGKGSPEQVQIAIQLVYRYRKVTMPPEKFVKADFVGLDCNGFVGNYYRKVVKEQSWRVADVDKDPGPTTLMDDLLALGTAVKETKDLQREGTYILVWCDAHGNIYNPRKGVANSYGHVMITEPNTLDGPEGNQTIHVVEATAAGERKLRDIDYTIKSSKKGIFQVERGSPSEKMFVRISRLAV